MGLSKIRMSRRLTGSLATAVLAIAAAGTMMVQARSPATPFPSSAIALTGLPIQGREVMDRIHQGGPFRYEKDGTVFGNRERLLPREKRGYYREYTVPTPGLNHRGARRIVCGGYRPQTPDNCYYTEDHYASFKLIVQ